MPNIVLATINAKWIHPSLALRLLKANLGSLQTSCEILEFALRQPLSEKVTPILAARPRLLGLSVSIWNHKATLELLEVLSDKWRSSDLPTEKPLVVLGGPEVSFLPSDAEIFRYADYVIRGDGEDRFRTLCNNVFAGDGSTPAGIEVAGNNDDHAIADVNTIASAYHLYTDEDLQKKHVYVEASRGCAFGCEYCQAGKHGQGGVREFPLEPFLAEMGTLIDRGARKFKFLDRSFNLNIDRAVRIMEFFLERIKTAPESSPLCVHFEMLPFRFPAELREVIRRFPPGSLRLEIGIQTFNTQTAALIHRAGSSHNLAERELEALEFLRRETNAIIHVDIIAGLPGEGLASFAAGFNRLWQALSGGDGTSDAACEIQVGILKGLPGTAILRHIHTHGMRYAPEPPYEIIETAALPAAEMARVKNFARFWEVIVNNNPFPDLLPRLLPPEQPAFQTFMRLADKLLANFGRNWGIDRRELRAFLE